MGQEFLVPAGTLIAVMLLSDIMLVWYLPYCTSLKHLRMGFSFLIPTIDGSNFVPAGKAVSQTPLSAVGRAPPPKNVL